MKNETFENLQRKIFFADKEKGKRKINLLMASTFQCSFFFEVILPDLWKEL